MPRETIVGPDDGPRNPFPIHLRGRIVKGFGRGSKELGIPTANLPIAGLDVGGHTDVESGIYFGWASICLDGVVQSSDAAKPPNPDQNGEEITSSTPNLTTTTTTPFSTTKDYKTYPAVLSIGYNPYYKNEKRSVEVHIIHKFEEDFYNAMMNLSILGFIRHEKDYESMQALIDDINFDIEVAKKSLDREAYQKRKDEAHLTEFEWR